MSVQHDRSRTETRELCILSFANFAYALPLPAPAIPKSGPKSLSIRTLHTLGGGGLKLKAHCCKLSADRSRPMVLFRTFTEPGLVPSPQALVPALPRSGLNSFRSRTLPTLGGSGGSLQIRSASLRQQQRSEHHQQIRRRRTNRNRLAEMEIHAEVSDQRR